MSKMSFRRVTSARESAIASGTWLRACIDAQAVAHGQPRRHDRAGEGVVDVAGSEGRLW